MWTIAMLVMRAGKTIEVGVVVVVKGLGRKVQPFFYAANSRGCHKWAAAAARRWPGVCLRTNAQV
jgi:hypothetical protein